MKKQYRLFNNDLNDIYDYYETLDRAKEFQLVNYFFMTTIQERKNGKWVDIA